MFNSFFQLQLKSSVSCQTCNFASNRFDPATFLTLPVPTDETTPLTIFLFLPTNLLKEFCFNIPTKCQVSTLLSKLRQRIEASDSPSDLGQSEHEFLLTRVVRHQIVQIYTDNDMVPVASNTASYGAQFFRNFRTLVRLL